MNISYKELEGAMKMWFVKWKGAMWWGNFRHWREITIQRPGKHKETFDVDTAFYRKKDAELFRQTLDYPDGFEVVGATLPKSKSDRRRRDDWQ